MKKIPLIIDSDTGIDDAVAISVACYTKNLDILLLCSSQGNTSVKNTTNNNLNILSYINKHEIPVAMGSGENFSKNDLSISAHGSTGLGNFDFPKHNLTAINEGAVSAIHDKLNQSSQSVTLLATGPLTTFAELLRKHPNDKSKIDQIVISGGLIETLSEGQAPYLSFNIAEDSVAAKEVLTSGIKIVVVPSNLGHDAYLTWQDVYKTKNINKTGAMLEQIFRSYKDRHVKNGIAVHDLCAILAISTPANFTFENASICLKYYNNLGYIDFNFDKNQANATIATSCNINKIKKLYFNALKKMP